MVDMSIEER